jgi:hypothetical protein
MFERIQKVIKNGTLARSGGRIALLLAAATPVSIIYLLRGPTAALWTAVAASAGLWAASDVLARRGPNTTYRVLRARKIELVTSDDRVIVALGETIEGKGAVALYDRAGECIAPAIPERRATDAIQSADKDSVLGSRSPFALGFGIDEPLTSVQRKRFAIGRSAGSRSKSAGHRLRRIASERRSQVLGAIELSCSFGTESKVEPMPSKTRGRSSS